MGGSKQAALPASDGRDDLERITGIGEHWAWTLYKIGILRFKDLAQRTPQDLSQLLAEAGFKASPDKTEKWIAEAKEREWETHAEFSVFFEFKTDEQGGQEWQTRVYGEGEKKYGAQRLFPGVEPAPWAEWIVEQAKLPVEAKPIPGRIEAAPRPTARGRPDVQIQILRLEFTEIRPSSGVREERLVAEVEFQVSGSDAAKLIADRISFQIEIYTLDLESHAFELAVSNGGRLEPGKHEYTSRQAFPLPELGRYEVYAVVHLLPPGESIAHCQGPKLTVVP